MSNPPASSATATVRPGSERLIGAVGTATLFVFAVVTVLYLSFSSGGYYPSAPGFAAVVLVQVLVIRTTLAQRPFEGIDWRLAVPLGGLVGYAAWELLSASWSHANARALDASDLTLLYVLALALFGSLANTRTRLGWLVRTVVLGMAIVCVVGLITRVLPDVWPTSSAFGNDRLDYPLTYWNGEGMLAAATTILLFHLSSDTEEPPAVRILSAALIPPVATALLLTFSRGALGITAIGLLTYVLIGRPRALLSALAAVVPAAAIALKAAWDAQLLALNDLRSPAAVAQGHHVAKVVLICLVVAGVLRGALLPLDRRLAAVRLPSVAHERRVRAAALGGGLVAIIVLAIALGLPSYAQREYHRFVNGNGGPRVALTRDRLTDPANNGRIFLWKAAVDMFDRQPLLGLGGGTFQVYWTQLRTPQSAYYVTDTHELYLQSLGELGVLGLALIIIVIGGILVGIATRIRGPDRALYAALFAAVLAWAIHSAVDWDWQMPATTIWVFILGGLALARRPSWRRFGDVPRNRTLLAIGWLLVAVAPLLVALSYARLHTAAADVRAGNCVAARQHALSSLSINAERPDAYSLIGLCDLEQGFPAAAVPAMSKAASLDPQNWQEAYWTAVARAGAGQDPRAAAQRALALNPLEPLARRLVRELGSADPRAWEAAAPGLRTAAMNSGLFAVSAL